MTDTTQASSAVTTTQQAAQNTQGPQIPQVVLEKYPDLVDMIKKTESMSNDEREYWYQILPIMTEEQVVRLRKILEDEATQLAKLDDQYQSELSKLNDKHLKEWNELDVKQKKEELKKQEAAHEAEETKAQEDILGQLNQL